MTGALHSIEVIGNGGFGVVDEVVDNKGQHFARKTFHIFRPDELDAEKQQNVLSRFKREVKYQERIRHKNIVQILHSEMNALPPYFLMPLAVKTLHDDLSQDRTLNGHYIKALLDILAGLESVMNL